MSAIGKLNARIISGTVGKPELSHYTDMIDSDFYPHLSDIRSQELSRFVEYKVCHHTKFYGDHRYNVLEHSLQSNLPIANDRDFFLLFMKDLKSILVWKNWRMLSSVAHVDILNVIRPIKIFYVNSVKLGDGFKFIIKIPDKLTIIPLK